MDDNEERSKNKVVVVMPAYNAERTLEKTFRDIPEGSVDKIILVDDGSGDCTVKLARQLQIEVLCHRKNQGYGACQKTCYTAALNEGADVIVMLHPDNQYDPRIIPYAVGFLFTDVCDIILGSRIRTFDDARNGGMPVYKYFGNRCLTILENIFFGQNLGDFHSGFRVYSRKVLERISFCINSNDFVFDTEFLAQAVYHGFRIGEVPVPCRYSGETSSISFGRSVKYGIQTIIVMGKYLLHRSGLYRFNIFK